METRINITLTDKGAGISCTQNGKKVIMTDDANVMNVAGMLVSVSRKMIKHINKKKANELLL